MKVLYSFLFFCLTVSSHGQIIDSTALKYFNEGLAQYYLAHYNTADSLFELSLKIEPSIDAVYYKAISGTDLVKLCSKCKMYRKNMLAGDGAAGEKYQLECIIEDSLIYSDISNADTIYYSKLSMKLCSGKDGVSFGFGKKRVKKNTISIFYIEPDTNIFTETNPIVSYPDLNTIASKNIYYFQTPEMPSFPGGEEGRIQYMQRNLQYPEEAKDNGISGKVFVTFTIDEQGYVKDPKVLKGIGMACDSECLRLIKAMPRWKPGKEEGKPVKFKFNVPVKFTLQ